MITAASFPTPDLALRSADPAELDRVRGFAGKQARIAERIRVWLGADLPGQTLGQRVGSLRGAYQEATMWRYELALASPRRLGQGIPLDADRFLLSAHEGGQNYDRIGYLGRLRAGSTWDPTLGVFAGGEETPASRIMEQYGAAALHRFDVEGVDGDVLQNVVRLPGRQIPGNQLVRGDAARRIGETLRARVAASGRPTDEFEIGPDPLYVVSADPNAADILFGIAMITLAGAVDEPDHVERLRDWQQARYLLYQSSPRTKKGSDAVNRVFLVAVGTVLFGHAPLLDQDLDLGCLILGQTDATMMPADASIHNR